MSSNPRDKHSHSYCYSRTNRQSKKNPDNYSAKNINNNNNLLNLDLVRRKRSEINDLINKELRIKHGAINLLKVSYDDQTEKKLRLEIAFADSNIKYLKDQLAELNCDFTLNKMKQSNSCNIDQPLAKQNKQVYRKLECFQNFENYNQFKTSTSSSSLSSPLSPISPLTNSIKAIKSVKTPIYLRQFDPVPQITITPSQSSNEPNEFIPINIPSHTPLNNSYSFSPSSSSTISTPTNTINSSNTSMLNQESTKPISKSNFKQEVYSLDEYQTKTADIMIYLNLKETLNNMDFSEGFRNFISNHFREDPNNFLEQIRQFNYFRESTIRLGYEPGQDSVQRLFEYFNSLNLLEKRFFQNSQCNHVFFTWYDSINGIESTQKSIQFEKASILFNCAALYTQIAAICSDSNAEHKPDEQLMKYWLQAAGCLNYLNTNFSNSPSLDMSSFMLYFFADIFVCQAYEIKSKLLLITRNEFSTCDPKHLFITFIYCSKIYSHLSEKYSQIHFKIANNESVKNYLPEIWFHLIKVKAIYFKGLSHYYASLAIITNGLEEVCDDLEVQTLFDSLHDKSRISSPMGSDSKFVSNLNEITMDTVHKSYFQKIIVEQQMLYSYKILKSHKRIYLAKSHMRESIVQQEEAIRQHSFCRKFSKDDYLHHLLCYYHEKSLDKFMHIENQISADFNDELFDLLPINSNLSEKLILKPIEPNLTLFESKDFFNLIGPMKVYSSENELSIPFSCILRKLPNQQTFGITVKGDCPVRINQVDPRSYAYSAGIREGDFIIAIQDHDVRWSKHAQVVDKIRSQVNSVKLTLINIRSIPKEIPIFCDDNENKKIKNCSDKLLTNTITPSCKKKIISTNFNSTNSAMNENNIGWNESETISKGQKIRQRFFRLPNSKTETRSKSPFVQMENNLNKLCNQITDKIKNKNSFKSTSNLYTDERIQFNDQDDEICSRENAAFWENLKSIKTPLTNTITLGRRFKRNVMKLNIFSSFNSNIGHEKEEKNAKNENKDLPPLPPNIGTAKTGKAKMIKKQKRLKELEKWNQESDKLLVQNDQVLYKTI